MAGKASIGAGLYGATLPLVLNLKLNIDADILALTDKIMAYGTGKNELSDRRDTLNASLEISREWITLGRDNFKPTFGSKRNARWGVVGMDGSLSVPATPMEVLRILGAFKELLTDDPTLEVPIKDITATHAGDLIIALNAAVTAVQGQEEVVKGLLDDRNAKAEALRKRMSDLIAELNIRMNGLDNRWIGFGLNKPDAEQTPDQVTELMATLIGPGTAALKWSVPARAGYYHVFKRVVGIDPDYVLVGSPADVDFTLEGLPAGATIQIVVSAVNSSGEGARSEQVTITTH
ncbi:MAG: family lipolytic protein [Verrucomicrobiales bacterium]|nr:family lipolytic protein [Verrucomicrobiales bacterium]